MVKWRILVTLAALVAALSQGAWSMSISDAKKLPDGQAVSLARKVVTYSATGYFYVEEDIRSIGIRVEKTGHALAVGMRADVVGTIQTKTTGNKERYIAASSAVQSAPPNDYGSVPPVGMNNLALGGADWLIVGTGGQRGVAEAVGLNNIGLLIKTWGKYQQTSATTFTVDDGAGYFVKCTVPSGTFLYSGWQYVAATGISSLYKLSQYPYPTVYPPNVLVRDIEVVTPVEAVSIPGTPTGYQAPLVNTVYTYSTTGSTCSWGQPIEYSFNWGDGSSSPWSTSTSASHSWSVPGIVTVTVTARCQTHPAVSSVSPGQIVDVTPELVSAPGAPTGRQDPVANGTYAYSTAASVCNYGHPVEYSYDWGDGTSSPWSTSTSASHAWSAAGPRTITVTARCQTHPGVSAVSPGLNVNVTQGPYMIYIPAGSFQMGNNGAEPYTYSNELPQHWVSLSGYYIGKYEVTRGEYQQFMSAGGYTNQAYWSTDGWDWKGANGRTQPSYWAAQQNWGTPPGTFTQTDNHPVLGVCYYECEAFCNWAGGHLPTEAQWEKAARWTGSHPNVYPWGDVWDQEKCNNWYDVLYPGYQTAPIGSYPSGASPYGCQDMAGNVWEWCKDWYLSDYYSQTPGGGWVDPQGPSSGSYWVLRGGCWRYAGDNYSRCAFRPDGYLEFPLIYSNTSGFRLAR